MLLCFPPPAGRRASCCCVPAQLPKVPRCFRFRFSTSRRTSLRTGYSPRQVPPVCLRTGLTCVSFCFSDSHRDLLSYSRVSRLALHSACARLLWPLLTSGGSSHHLSMTVAQRQTTRPPRVLRTHLHAYLCRIYAAASVQVSGFASIGLLTPLRRLVSAGCSSEQRFACSFLQIPPHDRHPCCSANISPCRVCRGLTPPSECALPGAPRKKPAWQRAIFEFGE